jgi:alpha-soluble NSF attachment protein
VQYGHGCEFAFPFLLDQDVGLTDKDLVTTQRLLDDFARKDVTFPSTREAKFAHELMQACEEADVERFTGAVFGYDQVTKLDNWKTGVLLRIKKALEEDEGGLT